MEDTSFTIKIAELKIKIYPVYECAKIFCRNYLIDNVEDEKSDILIYMKKEDAIKERKRDIRVRAYENEIPDDYPLEYLELLAIYRKIASKMLDFDRLLLHGSAISLDNKGFIFMADSGVGKSTHRKNWQDEFLDRVVLINDDKPIIHIKKNEAIVYGTPWSGKDGYNENTSAKICTIYALERNEKNIVIDITMNKKWEILTSQAFFNEKDKLKTIILIEKLIGLVPIKKLLCNKEREAALVAYNGFIDGNL